MNSLTTLSTVDHRDYKTREEHVRAEISNEEAMAQIKNYGGVCDTGNPNFDLYDQLLACEALHESQVVVEKEHTQNTHVYEDVITDANGSCKFHDNFELNADRLKAISLLKTCTTKTFPKIVSELLEIIFSNEKTYEGWWLTVAQHYPPRPIYRTIDEITKKQTGGWCSIKNPAAYFTYRMCYRTPRKGWTKLCKKQKVVNI